MEPEMKIEEQSWSPEFGAQRSICPKTGRLKEILLAEAQKNVNKEPTDEPSRIWDAQLQEFLEMLQDSHSGEGNTQEPKKRHWDNPNALEVPSEGETGAHSWPRARLADAAQEDHEIHRDATPSGKQKAGTTSGGGTEIERARCCFRKLGYQEAKGPYKLCRQLQACCRQWLKPERHTKEQILDLVTLEQFLAVLPLEMQSWVRERNPRSCAWAVALAEEFLLRQKEANSWEKQSWVRERNPRSCAWAVALAEEFLLSQKEAKRCKMQQITAMSEKKLANTNAEEALLGTVKRQLSIWPKEGNDVNMSLLGDGQLNESKGQKRLRESPEQTEQQKTTLKAGKEKDFLCLGEAVKKQHVVERKKRNNAKTEVDPFIIQQGVCKDATQQHEENDMGQGICGQKAHGSTDEVIPPEEMPYECWQCGRSFSSSSDLLTHERRSHVGDGQLSESKGQKRLRESPEQTEQQKMTLKAGKEKDFLCLGEAVKKQRVVERKKRNNAKTEVDPFIIQQGVCKDATQQHEENDMGQGICGQKAHGSTDEVIPTEEMPYECCQCGRLFSSSSDLLTHERRSHVGEKLYKCSHCGNRETIQIGQNVHKCSYCRKNFHWIPQVITSGREERYSCTECEKSYTSKSGLLKHQQFHRGKKPYKCCFCSEAYTNWLELKAHQQTHRDNTLHKVI